MVSKMKVYINPPEISILITGMELRLNPLLANVPMLHPLKTPGYKVGTLAEAVAQRFCIKKMFSEISQNSQENTCARVSFSIKLQRPATLLKKTFSTLDHIRKMNRQKELTFPW